MKKALIGLAVLPFLAGIASAAQPTLLSDAQMDKVTAGQDGADDEADSGSTAIALGDFDAKTATFTNTLASKVPMNASVAEAAAEAEAASAITSSFAAVGSNSAAAIVEPSS